MRIILFYLFHGILSYPLQFCHARFYAHRHFVTISALALDLRKSM